MMTATMLYTIELICQDPEYDLLIDNCFFFIEQNSLQHAECHQFESKWDLLGSMLYYLQVLNLIIVIFVGYIINFYKGISEPYFYFRQYSFHGIDNIQSARLQKGVLHLATAQCNRMFWSTGILGSGPGICSILSQLGKITQFTKIMVHRLWPRLKPDEPLKAISNVEDHYANARLLCKVLTGYLIKIYPIYHNVREFFSQISTNKSPLEILAF